MAYEKDYRKRILNFYYENGNAKLKRIGIKERFGQVGTLEFLMNEYELTAEHIYKAALELLKD